MTVDQLARASAQPQDLGARNRRLMMRIILVALVVPISFEVAGIRLTPSMIVLIGLLPWIVIRYLSGAAAWRLPDLFFLMYVSWQGLSFLINNPERFITYTGTQILLTMTGYLSGRLLVQNKDDFYAFVRWVALIIIFSMPFALYEFLMDEAILFRLINQYTPFNTFNDVFHEPRLGFYRAQVFFLHPIHYGLLSALFLMPVFIGLKGHLSGTIRLATSLLIGIACFLSISSGGVLSVLLQLGIWVWYRAAALIGWPWRIVIGMSGVAYTILELASTKSAFVAIGTRLAFDANTAFYRTLIWQYGTEQVARTPIFGNGEKYWARPNWMINSSVDNYWLLIAIQHGLPALVFLLSAIFYGFFMVNRASGPNSDPAIDRLRLAWTLSLIGFCMSAFTVAIWGEIQLFFMILFGAGFWMINPDSATDDQAAVADQADGRSLRYTRFATDRPTPSNQTKP